MVNIAVLVSGGGTNLQALINAQARGELDNGKLALVVASSARAYALERATHAGIKTAVISRLSYDSREAWDTALLALLQERGIGLVVLGGYLSILGPKVLAAYEGMVINVHPSLIPSFCGERMYGLRVHQAAMDYGVKVTGATVHIVSDVVDGGKILLQKSVDVKPDDTPDSLQKRVMEEAEWKLLPQAVKMLCVGKG